MDTSLSHTNDQLPHLAFENPSLKSIGFLFRPFNMSCLCSLFGPLLGTLKQMYFPSPQPSVNNLLLSKWADPSSVGNNMIWKQIRPFKHYCFLKTNLNVLWIIPSTHMKTSLAFSSECHIRSAKTEGEIFREEPGGAGLSPVLVTQDTSLSPWVTGRDTPSPASTDLECCL